MCRSTLEGPLIVPVHHAHRWCLQKHTALQTEFDELNHMLTHQPPSAWAKREKKYHDDKKAWDQKEAEMRGKTKRLQDEVQMLKDNNRAVVLQEQVKA